MIRVPTLLVATAFAVVLAFVGARPAQANTTNCYLATSEAAHTLCFLDFGGYTLASGTTTPQNYPFTIKLPDGSLVSGTLTNSGQALGAPTANAANGATTGIVPLPTLNTTHDGGSALGNYSATAVTAGDATSTTYEGGYLGVLGNPAFYDNNTVGPIALSNISITDSTGASEGSTITIAAADAEDTAAADYETNGTAGLYWTTTGGNLVEVQLVNQMSTTTSLCTFTLNAQTATCLAKNGQHDPGSAYILSTQLTAPTQAFTMKTITPNDSGEAFAFAFRLGTLDVAKVVGSRLGTDQFIVAVKHGTATAYSATTTGTTTGAASTVTAGGAAVPGVAYTLTDTTTSGSNPISEYATTYSCLNATTNTTTTGAAQSVAVTPVIDEAITCTFTNNQMSLTDTAATPAVTVAAGSTRTDSFTLKNTSGVAGKFAVAQPTIVTSGGTVLTPSATTAAYILNNATTGTCSVATPCTLATLNSTIAAAAQTAVDSTIVVGVEYTVPNTPTTITATVPATIANGTGTSAEATASETDTVPGLAISKTGTTAASPGGLIAYTLLVSNTSGVAENGAVVTDPLPTGVTFEKAMCAAASGAACAAPTSATTGGVTTVSDTITTLPVGGSATITIYTAAGAAGTVTNQATVTPPAGTGGGAQSSAVVTTTIAQANGITKTVKNLTHTQYNSGTFTNTNNAGLPGDTLQYSLSFTNNTGVAITNLAFADPLPAQVTYVSTSCSGSSTPLACTATPAGAPTTYTFSGSLAVGATETITINVTIK